MSSIKLTADSGGGTFEIKAPSSSGNTRVLTLPDTGNLTLNGGKILQVVQTVKTSFFSTTSTSSDGVEVTGLNVAITPTSSSNKILVSCSGYYGNGNNDSFASLFLARQIDSGSTDTGIAVGDTRGSAKRATMSASLRNGGGDSSTVGRYFGCEFLDSPNTTGVCTYKIFMVVTQGTPACIGGSQNDGDGNHQSYPTFITAKEVAA
tara:strand:- start:138 stop:755 length:618 start_codon:yes stop_codon:yes gene_type:complete